MPIAQEYYMVILGINLKKAQTGEQSLPKHKSKFREDCFCII